MRKAYRFIAKHFTGFIRVWFLLLIPCAISKHFASCMVTANVAVWLLVMHGEKNNWYKEDE